MREVHAGIYPVCILQQKLMRGKAYHRDYLVYHIENYLYG